MSNATAFRTHACGELTAADAGAEVVLCGAVHRELEPRLYDLRDAQGFTRVRFGPGVGDEELKTREVKKPALESILRVKGTVVSEGGQIVVEAKELEFISFARDPLLFDPHGDVPEAERIRHRYLWLRSRAAHENFRFRTQVVAELRRHLIAQRFEEVETPLLANRWTPGLSEVFLAARELKQLFALPGERTVHGALLMAGGFDRVFEIARRFRRIPSYDAFQQPEYDVLDGSVAYVDEENLFKIVDELLKTVDIPGYWDVLAAIMSTSSSCVFAFFQADRGLSETKTSETSKPIGSVATSAVPVRVQTSLTSSGNAFMRMASSRVP